jgi:chlorite dismutase
MENRIITHYAMFRFNRHYWNLLSEQRMEMLRHFCEEVDQSAKQVWFYQVYPTQVSYDMLVWSSDEAGENSDIANFMTRNAMATNKFRGFIEPVENFWGVTKPSQYSKAKKSAQEIEPFEAERKPYFIIYPFSKTTEWYLKSREERQEMMNGHITIGKQYREISQLLLYSFGMQDQEFVVAYEADNLPMFSDLVYELRSTQARLYTLRDTPIITGIFKNIPDMLELVK